MPFQPLRARVMSQTACVDSSVAGLKGAEPVGARALPSARVTSSEDGDEREAGIEEGDGVCQEPTPVVGVKRRNKEERRGVCTPHDRTWDAYRAARQQAQCIHRSTCHQEAGRAVRWAAGEVVGSRRSGGLGSRQGGRGEAGGVPQQSRGQSRRWSGAGTYPGKPVMSTGMESAARKTMGRSE